MDLHIYTRELLDKHLLPELKEIAQGLAISPEGNKTRRETWVAALVGQPFPLFQLIEIQRQEPIAQVVENAPGVEVEQVQEPIAQVAENSAGVEFEEVPGAIESKFDRIVYPRPAAKIRPEMSQSAIALWLKIFPVSKSIQSLSRSHQRSKPKNEPRRRVHQRSKLKNEPRS